MCSQNWSQIYVPRLNSSELWPLHQIVQLTSALSHLPHQPESPVLFTINWEITGNSSPSSCSASALSSFCSPHIQSTSNSYWLQLKYTLYQYMMLKVTEHFPSSPLYHPGPSYIISCLDRSLLSGLSASAFVCLLLLLLSRFSRVRLLATPWTAAYQVPLSAHGIFQAKVLEWGAAAFSDLVSLSTVYFQYRSQSDSIKF